MKNKLKVEWMLERGHNIEQDKHLLKMLDSNSFNSVLIRTGSIFPDPWLVASSYAGITNNLNFIIAVNPVMMHPVYCAIKIVTFQKIYGNRISVNLVSGASTEEQNIFGDTAPMQSRYIRTGEFAQILKKLVTTGKIDKFEGHFYNMQGVEIESGKDFEIVFAGSSDNTIELANSFGSAHYYSMETSEQYKESRKKIKVNSAIKTTMIVEDTNEKAWEVTKLMLDQVSQERIDFLKKDLATHESENQKRQQTLHNFSINNLNVENNIWSGMGLFRGGGITSMVGGYLEISNLIEKFYNNGLDRILIGATPETYYANNFIQGVIPILKERGVV